MGGAQRKVKLKLRLRGTKCEMFSLSTTSACDKKRAAMIPSQLMIVGAIRTHWKTRWPSVRSDCARPPDSVLTRALPALAARSFCGSCVRSISCEFPSRGLATDDAGGPAAAASRCLIGAAWRGDGAAGGGRRVVYALPYAEQRA